MQHSKVLYCLLPQYLEDLDEENLKLMDMLEQKQVGGGLGQVYGAGNGSEQCRGQSTMWVEGWGRCMEQCRGLCAKWVQLKWEPAEACSAAMAPPTCHHPIPPDWGCTGVLGV